MIDKNTRKILKYFIEKNDQQTMYTIANGLNISDITNIEKSIQELLEINCIKISYRDITCTKYSLTNKGKFFFKNNFKSKFDKYLFPIILSIISFGLGLLSGLLIG